MIKNSLQSRICIGLVGFFMGALLALNSFAQSVLPVPALTARVIDQTATLAADQIASIEAQLKKIETERGAQVVVLMVASTQPEDIFSFSNRVANDWKIGRKGVGDGVLIVVAKNDRKLRIEIAKSLEGAIPDVLAGQIVREAITPQFKQDQYASGLKAGIEQIAARIAGEALALPAQQAQTSKTSDINNAFELPSLPALFVLLFLLVFAFKFLGFGNTLILLSSITRGGGSAYSSGGGGFSSGGGGNFGGGGASGDW